jgi:Tol biopolymer transport system component
MSDLTFSPEFENQIRSAMEVPEPDSAFLNDLRQQLLAQSKERSHRAASFFSQPALRWGLAVLAVILVLILAIGPQRVASAFQRLLGYIPGVGLVDQNVPMRVLEAEVTQTRENVTVTVERVFLDANRTVLVFKFDGVPMDTRPEGESSAYCSEKAMLRLPDGDELDAGMGWGTGWGSGYEYHFEFPPVPSDVKTAVFVIPCLMGTESGDAPENWELPLRFIPAPPELTVYPVIELPTPTASPVPSVTPTAREAAETAIPEQPVAPTSQPVSIYLTLDRVAQLEDGIVIYATFHWESNEYAFVAPGMAQLLDADGKPIPFEYADPDLSAVSDMHQQPLAIKALGPFSPGPITLMIETAHTELPVDASFSFDVGSNPQPGDTWELNRPLEVDGHTITVLSAQAIDSNGHQGFEFWVDIGSDIESVRLIDPEHPPMGGGGGGGGGGGVAETVRMTQLLYGESLPTGLVTIAVQSIALNLQGPWQATWTPIEDLLNTSSQDSQATCLTSDTWAQAKQQNPSLPAIWTGKLAHYGPVEEGENWHISVINLDNNQEQPIGPGTWPALSPDGSRLVYSGSDGLYVTDLATGESNHLPATNENDYNPLWSPDGEQIAFVRGAGAFDIFSIAPDGTNLRPLTVGPTYESLGSWLPDSQHILYGTPNADGILLHLLEIESGAVEDLFTIKGTKDLSIAVSPDGTRLAYLERVFGYKVGLYITDLDGSNRQFFADTTTEVFSSPIWSPDGKWLLLSIWDEQVNDVLPFLALVQVENCQIVPIPERTGQFSSWVP